MIIAKQAQLNESGYRPWNYGEYKKLLGREFRKLRLVSKDKMRVNLMNIQVVDGQPPFIDFKSANRTGGVSISFDAIVSVATTVDSSWELRLRDGTLIYLDLAK